jgi:hypothetical protein
MSNCSEKIKSYQATKDFGIYSVTVDMDSQETIQFSSVPGKDLAHNKITIG